MFPLAGFFSKDEIIDNVGHNGYEVFMWIALVGAFLTAAYTVRATYLTFFGEPRGAAAVGTEHEGEHSAPSCRRTTSRHDIQQEGELETDAPRRRRRRARPRRTATTPTTTTTAHTCTARTSRRS